MELVRNLLTQKSKSNLELSSREALEQVVAHLDYQRVNYERLPLAERKGHIWEAVRLLKRELLQEVQPPKRQVNGPVQGY
jgi:hypothetical protein